jgi:hypothetical protein
VPTLDDFRKEAKDWLKQVRRNNSGPVKRLRLAYPNAPARPILRDIQHALAREHGYESWKALKTAVERRDVRATWEAPDVSSHSTHADRVTLFLQLACWNNDVHGRSDYALREAAALRWLRKHPEIARDSVFTAVLCGDVAEVERRLVERPALANEKGGPWNWEPILYLCYGRVPLDVSRENAAAMARVLLDGGADPNAYYPAGHAVYGTLVGVAGEGEQQARPHPQRESLYRLLLEGGAELYDIQVLYNTHFHGDMLWWLQLTYDHALRTGRAGDWSDPEWRMLDMGGYGTGARFVLRVAIDRNRIDLAEWALAHGANPNAPPPPHPQQRQESLYDYAILRHRSEIAELLGRYGARRATPTLTGEDAYVAACLRLDRAEAERQLERHPEYRHSPNAMFAAAADDRSDAIELLLRLGTPVDVEDQHRQRPLHSAAGNGARRAAAVLIQNGADVDRREMRWKAPPIGYAAHNGHTAMVDFLAERSRDVWHLAFNGKLERLRAVLSDEPDRARELSADGVTPLWWLPNDEAQAVGVAELLLAHGTDPRVRSKGGTTAADAARRRGLDDAADLISASAAR